MTLSQGLPECGFLENLPDVVFSDVNSDALLTLTCRGFDILHEELMIPDSSGRITVFVKEIVRGRDGLNNFRKSAFTQGHGFFTLPEVSVRIDVGDDYIETTGRFIPGVVENNASIDADWFRRNFLTWQPQIISTTADQPQWLYFIPTLTGYSKVIRSRIWGEEGYYDEKVLNTDVAGNCNNIAYIASDLQSLWGAEMRAEEFTPLAYEVYGQVPGHPEIKFLRPQRYVLRKRMFNDVCFGFVNALGGFDTLMISGAQSYQPEGDMTTFTSSGIEQELSNNFRSIWEANTGFIDSERVVAQYMDFFRSTNRYVLRNGVWQRIIVTEYKVKHQRGELNSYTFKYHLAQKNEGRYYDAIDIL